MTSGLAIDRQLSWRLSPLAFARSAGFTADPWQADVLRSNADELLLCSRQSGKSETAALAVTHVVVTRRDALALLFAPSERQSSELLLKAKRFLRALGPHAPAVRKDNERSLELENGARIIALHNKEASVRGYSAPDILCFDEAARCDDSLWEAVAPMRAVGAGRVIALSSAWAEVGWFWSVWTYGGPEWHRTLVPASQCPRITPRFLAAERARMPARVFDREYNCVFGDASGEYVFSSALLASVLSAEVVPVHSVLSQAA